MPSSRSAFWIPKDKRQLETLRAIGKDHGQPISAIFFSYATFSQPQYALNNFRGSAFEWREYAAYFQMITMPEEMRRTLLQDQPYKYRAGVGDDVNANSVYLLFMESAIARKENPNSGQ